MGLFDELLNGFNEIDDLINKSEKKPLEYQATDRVERDRRRKLEDEDVPLHYTAVGMSPSGIPTNYATREALCMQCNGGRASVTRRCKVCIFLSCTECMAVDVCNHCKETRFSNESSVGHVLQLSETDVPNAES